MQKDKSIILMGIKHSGKSTQGKLISAKLNLPFIDIDDEIQSLTGKSPREIYAQDGAGAFMQAEEDACRTVAQLYKEKAAVISTGGGICDNAPALTFLRTLGTFVYIQIEEKTAADRIIKKASQNTDGTWNNLPAYIAKSFPKTEKQIREIFHTFYEQRTKSYEKIADITVLANADSKEANCKKIIEQL